LNQRQHDCGALAAAIGAGEQPTLPAKGNPAQLALGRIVAWADAAVLEEACEGVEATASRENVTDHTAGPDPHLRKGKIDKSVLTIGMPRRYRNKDHLRFVAQQPCLLCGRKPSDPHHLRFVQPRALGRKASDEFAVPLCRVHHREVHRAKDEKAWWQQARIEPLKVARKLWKETRVEEGHIEPEALRPSDDPAKPAAASPHASS
jgi:hypothetical protein